MQVDCDLLQLWKIDHVRIYEANRIITADQKERRQINRHKRREN